MIRLLLTAVLAAGLATGAGASTPQAWAQLNRDVDRACLAAAGLARGKVVADKASFTDRVPVELRVVEGYNKQSVIDVKLCAYDRRTKRAAITDGVGRIGVNRR